MPTASEIKGHMSAFLKLPADRLDDARVLTDLVVESFVLVEMVIDLQEEFGVRVVQEDLKDVRTVGDLAALFASRVR